MATIRFINGTGVERSADFSDQLQYLIDLGTITPDTLVFDDRDQRWRKAQEVANELADVPPSFDHYPAHDDNADVLPAELTSRFHGSAEAPDLRRRWANWIPTNRVCFMQSDFQSIQKSSSRRRLVKHPRRVWFKSTLPTEKQRSPRVLDSKAHTVKPTAPPDKRERGITNSVEVDDGGPSEAKRFDNNFVTERLKGACDRSIVALDADCGKPENVSVMAVKEAIRGSCVQPRF